MTSKFGGRIKVEQLGTDVAQYLTTYRFRHHGECYLVYVRFRPRTDRYSVRVVHERTRELIRDSREEPGEEEDMTQDRDAIEWARWAIRDAWDRKTGCNSSPASRWQTHDPRS